MAAADKTQGAPLPAKLASLLREAKWLVLVALAGYLFLVLATFRQSDPGWSHSATAAVAQNAGGRFGAWLADILLYLFGLSAYWWVALCLYVVVWGYRRLDGSALVDRRPLALAVGGFLLLIVASAAVEALRFHSLAVALPDKHGGVIGYTVANALSAVAGFTGATLVLVTLAAVGLSLFTGMSWLAVAEGVGALLEAAYALALGLREQRRDRRLGELAREERDVVVDAERKREE